MQSVSKWAGRALMEEIEGRRMMSVSFYQATSLSDLSGNYFGQVLVGDNGNACGMPTVVVGQGDEQLAWCYPAWDSNLDDGLDSGWVATSFQLGSGGISMDVAKDGSASYASGSPVSVSQVTLRTAVTSAGMEMSWRDLVVNFYKGGQIVESITVDELTANTMNSASSDAQESVAVVTGNSTDYDAVTVTGQARLMTAEGTYASPGDIFGQVLVS
jgi:hypothetical protein